MKPPRDQVLCLASGEFDVMVDGRIFGSWDTKAMALGGMKIEQRRAAGRRARWQERQENGTSSEGTRYYV